MILGKTTYTPPGSELVSGFPDLSQDLTILPTDVARMNLCSQHLDEPVHVGRFGREDIHVFDLDVMVIVECLNLCSATDNLYGYPS
jgi:hypothetical protein